MAKKVKIKPLRKGKRCEEGWSKVEIKVGKVTRKMCVRGKVMSRKPSAWERIESGVMMLIEAVT